MKKLFTLLILLFGVLSTLMAETYTQKVTVYAPATCSTTDIVFYGYKNKSDKSPYKTVSGQPTSMYMNGLVLYKAEIPFNDVVYVKCTYKIKDSGDINSEFSNEITQTCSRYCGLDGVSSRPDPSAWYNTFDEAKYNQEYFDLNYKANEGTLYVVYDKGRNYTPAVSVYSSEYGEQYITDISANTVAEFSLLGNSLFAYTVADYEVYDRVKYQHESTFTIDWNKPFYYDGAWYAKLSDIPIKNILKEESCYYIHLVDDFNSTEMYHIGDNIYSCIYNDFYGGLCYFNKDSETKFECRTYCGEELATMNVELKQYGSYTLEFTYNANTNKIECKSELQQADRYIISAFNYSSIYNAPQMELVGENEYSFSLTTTRDKGLYYYDIYSAGGREIIKDKLIQIPETGTYDITITYNAETQATSCTVNKADPLAPIYLRGTVNNWGVDERYKLTTTDGNYYVATYTKGNEVEIGDVNGGTAEFKIGSGNSDYTPINFGGNKVIERGGSYRLTSKGVNLKVNGSLKVSKIEFRLSENKLTITPAVQEVKKIYYVNKWGWYNVDINVQQQDGISDYFSMNKESVTYQGYEVYSYELPTYYSTVYFDGNGEYGYSRTTTIALDFTKPYYYDGVWYETLTFDTESEGGEGEGEGGEVTPPTPTVFDITTDQGVAFVVNPNSANPVFVPLTHNSYNLEFQTAQYTGTYTVTDLDFTAKIGGLTNLDVINYGTNGQALAPKFVYNPTRGASNGFRIVVGDYEVGDILNINATFDSYWNVTLIIDVTKTLEPTPNDITLYYVNSNEWDTVNGYVWPTGGAGILDWPGSPATKIDKTVDGFDVYSYTFDSTAADNIIFNAGLGGAQTKDLAVNASKPYYYGGVWYETLTFDGEQGGEEGGDQGGDDTPVDVDYIYIINTPGMGLEKITKYYSSTRNTVSAKQPVVISEKAAGYDVYRFEIDADATGIKWFTPDCSSELGCAAFGVSQLERTTPYYANRVWYSSLEAANTWYVQFSGCDYVGCYPVREVQSGIYELKLENITQSCSYRYVAGDCGKGKEFRAITKSDDPYDYFDLEIPNDGGTYTATLTLNTNNWTQSLSVVKEGGDQGGDDTGDVEIGEPANLYIIGALTGWAADSTWQFRTADDEYFVLSFPKGQEQELSGLFKVASSNWSPYNYGAPLDLGSVEAGKEYVLEYNVATNLSIANIIKVSKIEFTLSTQTLKITGATEEKVFDTTSDYGFHIYADYKDYPFTFKGDGVYEYDYTGVGPSTTIGDYQYKTVEWGRNSTGNTVTLGELYQLALSNRPIAFPDAAKGQTLTIVLTVSSDWSATILVKDKSSEEGGDPVEPETPAYVVRGNGGSDATGIWCGGIEWTVADSPVNNMTDADEDGIYEVTYKNVPAGTWNFKVVKHINAVQTWMGSDYLDTENSSAGYTTAPYDGNIGFTLNAPADVTIKFNTLTGKIIVTTPSGSFGKVKIDHFHITTGSEDVCLDQYEFTEANNYTLTFTEDIVVNPEYGYGYAYYRIIGNCSYAVYEKNFGIDVTVSGTYTVTVQFNGDYENPDFTVTAVKQGGSDEPVVPDPVISDIAVPTFSQIEVGEIATATLTYTLENATSATATVEAPFYIQSQSVVNGKGTVKILFMPEAKGVHTATLSIKSGNVTETASLVAKAVDPKPEVLPVISNINVPAFADTYINATNVVTATYSLANATEATATISGTNADAFYILSQSVGSVKILFMPEAKGTYNAILTITSGKTTESVNFTAKAIEFIPEPEPAISNVNVPAFATIEIGSAANVTATFTLENATEVSATLSGTGTDAFILGQPMVNNGNGSIKIAFVPENAGTYTATLTLKSGKTVHTATITAVATEPAPQVRIENIQVPVFEEVYLGGYTSVNVTYTLVNATKATVTVTGDVFSTGSNVVVGGKGTVPVDFMPETAGVHTATLTITAGGVSESVTLVAIAKLKSTDEPSGKVTISNIQVPEFASITAKETTTVTASYVLIGATSANASLSGTDAAYFTILSQTLSEGVGQVEIKFAPTVAREYNATLVVTSGSVTESIDFSATASEAPSISGLHVNDFGTVYVGEKVTVMANYSLAYAETATATLSGDTDVFAISRQMVSDGNGVVRIDFTPNAVGTYHATLTIKSGVSEESISFSATAIKYEEPEIEPIISNLIVPEFGEVLIGETVQKIATYTLENATEATATLSGDAVFTITRTLNGAVRIMFTPTAAGTYNGTLTITSGKVSESKSFSATAIKDVEPEIEPVISNLIVPDFGEVLIGETVQRIATYTLENATEATATLSGDAAFTITRTLNGAVRIMFAPTEAGTYNGTLTITSGSVSESIDFSAKAVKEGGEEPGPGPEDPVEPEKPDPLPSYPVRGYMYVVNTPDAHLERMVKYKPVSIDKVDYFLAPEKIETKIYGYDIYKFEVRDEEMIDLWEYPNAQYTSWHINVNADLSATPYLANGVWYASIEEMMTWYVRYIPNWDDEASEKMIVESPNVYVATFDAFAESDDNDKYYYCLGNVENPILEVGVSESGNILNYLQIPQGFKAMIYLDDTNWETAWKTYYKLVPPGEDWNRDCIDLGLSSGLCWATKNLGATEPQQEGTHFAWGEVEPKEDYSYNTYKWANLLKNNEYIKYVTDDYWGTIVDFRTTLEPTDDAANVALEGKWHMPTQADVEELLRECTTEFGSYYGVNGYFVTGPNGNAIFLPAVGIKEGTDYEESTRGGDYWTSSLYEDNQKYAVTLSFALTYIEIDDMQRTNGLAIRPVIHKDYVGIEEVVAINVYAKDHTIYCEEPFQIYTVTGLEVTHLNGALEGVYIVKTEKGNRLVSVW